MRTHITAILFTVGLVGAAIVGCGDDDPPSNPSGTTGTTGTGTGGGGTGGGGTGGGTGGSLPTTPCETYCATVTDSCTGDNSQYDDVADCVAYCDASGWDLGSPSAQGDNSINCRTYHATVAKESPEAHCPHAGPSGGEVCGTVAFEIADDNSFDRVDRMGMPAVSTALVLSSAKAKDDYNDGNPVTDTAAANGPEVIASLTAIHDAIDDDLIAAGLLPCSMTTIVNTFPECIGQAYAPGAIVGSLVLPDTLTIDTTKPAGFPNGRKLDDRVIDITLAVLLLKLDSAVGCAAGPCTAGTLAGLDNGNGLNPAKNDVADGVFLTTFPYLHPPHTP